MNDEVESVTPMSDEAPRLCIWAHDTVAEYRSRKSQPQQMTQADIDGHGSRSTADYTRRAIRGYHASLLRRLLNLLRGEARRGK